MPLFRINCIIILLIILAVPLHAAEPVHHSLKVTLIPREHRIIAVDAITLPTHAPEEITFTLHNEFAVSASSPLVRVQKSRSTRGPGLFDTYTITRPHDLRSFTLRYEGSIYHPPEKDGQEQARGFSISKGVIAPEGISLSGASGWYPDLGTGLVTFDLEAKLPRAWDGVSQGERTRHDPGDTETLVRWKSPEPQEEIYFEAGLFHEYRLAAGKIQAMAFLREQDTALATKYLEATSRYIDLYTKLIGPYPYKKFALVENFWETGFGMPSFTLLGPKIIRLPFIVNTSYPHEILHTWWGNSVYPEYSQGNWTEGLTAYLADHLLKEQQGGGAEYRMTSLQKYADYVLGNRDFPLTEFRSRHSHSTEAIGYGKALMVFHMLRLRLGDDTFRRGLREFYKDYQFQFASWSNIRTSFEAASGTDLKQDFDQWITRIGAPQLKVNAVSVSRAGSEYALTALLEQTQPGDAYQLRIPIAVTLDGSEQAYQSIIAMKELKTGITLTVPRQPLRLDIDPEFDVFRRLDRAEIPAAISQALGAEHMLMLLPEAAPEKIFKAYQAFAHSLKGSGPDRVEIKVDSEIRQLPEDSAVVILGWENRYAGTAKQTLAEQDVSFGATFVRINRTEIPKKDHALVLASRMQNQKKNAVLLIVSDSPDALPGLGQKLPHYHKYSYLAFSGKEPANIAKGRWPVLDSPLTVFIPDSTGKFKKNDMAGLGPRDALASLEPVFSRERMMESIRFLSSPELGGRGFGSPGLDKAAEYLALQFKAAGLTPGGDSEGTWFQSWEDTGNDPEQKAVLKNVIGVIPGKKPELAGQSVVLGAHYDHLGVGWPESRDNAKGKVHPGADDNASGVAVMLELARTFAKGPRPDRTIVFIAFTGEEAGKRGSRYYVANEKRRPVSSCIGMVNLDTVGRLGKKKLLVLGAGSAQEWVHIFRGAGFVTGVELETVSQELDSSDHKSFQDAGIPAVQLFSGPNLDYHRTTDTADKIDANGLVKVASVAKEAIEYLAGREIPLTTGTRPVSSTATGTAKERKVSLGTIPDFEYQGKGFRLSGVVEGSSAEAAGLREGDVIVRMNGAAVENLKDFSDILKTMNPGDKASILLKRDAREVKFEIEARER